MMPDIEALATQKLVEDVHARMDGEITVGHVRAAELLGVEPATLAAEGDAGRINYIQRGKRRVYSLPFLVAYLASPRVEDKKCRSTGGRAKTGGKPRSSTTTSSGTVVGFREARAKRRGEKLS
jgi:hypothetical protein